MIYDHSELALSFFFGEAWKALLDVGVSSEEDGALSRGDRLTTVENSFLVRDAQDDIANTGRLKD